MAGRRRLRAASTSTVATVDEDALRFQNESSVLRPAYPPDESQSENWPCFLLEDATVYNSRGEIANLLHADSEGPFVIRGRLNIEPDQVVYCKPASMFIPRIEAHNAMQSQCREVMPKTKTPG